MSMVPPTWPAPCPCSAVLKQAKKLHFLSDEHFTVDGGISAALLVWAHRQRDVHRGRRPAYTAIEFVRWLRRSLGAVASLDSG